MIEYIRKPFLLVGILLAIIWQPSLYAGEYNEIVGPSADFFARIFGELQDNYIDPVSLDKLVDVGLDAMASLDEKILVSKNAGLVSIGSNVNSKTWNIGLHAQFPTKLSLDLGEMLYFYREVSPKARAVSVEELEDKIASAMLSSLDSHSEYYPESITKTFTAAGMDSIAGIGLELLRTSEGAVTVNRVIQGGPAEVAGIKIGDEIKSIDEYVVSRQDSLTIIVKKLQGSVGSLLRLSVTRFGKVKPVAFSIKRAVIKSPPIVEYQLLGNDVVYVRVRYLSDSSSMRIAAAFSGMKDINAMRKGIVLDLRSNPGGLMNEVSSIASFFIARDKTIGKLAGRSGSGVKYLKTSDISVDLVRQMGGRATDIVELTRSVPLIVIVDKVTGAGAELLTKALKDSRGAIIVGQKTSGYCLVQAVYPIRGGKSAMKYPGWELVTASSKKINGVGITPDIEVVTAANNTSDSITDPAVEAAVNQLSSLPD